MKTLSVVVPVIFLALIAPALARADGGLCVSPADLSSHSRSCADNRIFTDYADHCLDRLVGQVRAAGLALSGQMSPDKVQSQTAKFEDARALGRIRERGRLVSTRLPLRIASSIRVASRA